MSELDCERNSDQRRKPSWRSAPSTRWPKAAFRSWLLSDMLPREPAPSTLDDEITGWFVTLRVVRPGSYRLARLICLVRVLHDDAVLAAVADRLDDEAKSLAHLSGLPEQLSFAAFDPFE